ncbi:MAG: phosphoribosylformylglycinamidine synthase subunit PurS [Alphaproteobacteria bacterium]
MKTILNIQLKEGVLDPQGKAIENALSGLGFAGVDRVRQGKRIEIWLDETDAERARAKIDEMARALLANQVIETYSIETEATKTS